MCVQNVANTVNTGYNDRQRDGYTLNGVSYAGSGMNNFTAFPSVTGFDGLHENMGRYLGGVWQPALLVRTECERLRDSATSASYFYDTSCRTISYLSVHCQLTCCYTDAPNPSPRFTNAPSPAPTVPILLIPPRGDPTTTDEPLIIDEAAEVNTEAATSNDSDDWWWILILPLFAGAFMFRSKRGPPVMMAKPVDDIEAGNGAEMIEMTGRVVNLGFDTQPTAQIALGSFPAGTEGVVEHKELRAMIRSRSSSYGNALDTGGGPADLDLVGASSSWDAGHADSTQSPDTVELGASDGGVATNTAELHVRDPETLVADVSNVAQVQTAEMGLNLPDAIDVDIFGMDAGASCIGSTTRESNPNTMVLPASNSALASCPTALYRASRVINDGALPAQFTADELSAAATSVARRGLNDASGDDRGAASNSEAPVPLYRAIEGINSDSTSDNTADVTDDVDAAAIAAEEADVMVWDPRNSRGSFKVRAGKSPRGVSLIGASGTDPDPALYNRMSVLSNFGDAFPEEEDEGVPDAAEHADLSASMFSPGGFKSAARPSGRAFSDKVGKLTQKTLTSPIMQNTTSI